MSPQRKAGSARAGTGRTEIVLEPEQLAWVRSEGIDLSALVRDLLAMHIEDTTGGALGIDVDPSDGRRIIDGVLRRLPCHGLQAMGRQVRVARLALGDADGLAAALAEVPDGWEARTTTTGRVRVVARPVAVWRVFDG